MNESTIKIIMWGLLSITAMIILGAIIISYHPYTIRFEMDNNTLEAIKSINYTAMRGI